MTQDEHRKRIAQLRRSAQVREVDAAELRRLRERRADGMSLGELALLHRLSLPHVRMLLGTPATGKPK